MSRDQGTNNTLEKKVYYLSRIQSNLSIIFLPLPPAIVPGVAGISDLVGGLAPKIHRVCTQCEKIKLMYL